MTDWSAVSTPELKLEASPAESLLSVPGGIYSSLFPVAPCDIPTTTADASQQPSTFRSLTPQSVDEDALRSVSPPTSAEKTTSTPEKKPAKKRKSWGQVLPEPKTNLPPRKRAKTEDEKEQRRVERVLRNRRAAQSSRERKRLEVEALERRNKELEDMLLDFRKEIQSLRDQLASNGKAPVTAATNSVTFSQELFSSQSGHIGAVAGRMPVDSFLAAQPATINPVSLSPPLNPVPDNEDGITIKSEYMTNDDDTALLTKAAPLDGKVQLQSQEQQQQQQQQQSQKLLSNDNASSAANTLLLGPSPDKTQRPAATLCHDLQCLSAEVPQVWSVQPPQGSQAATAAMLLSQLNLLFLLCSTVTSAFSRPLTQIAMCLKTGFSIPPTPAALNSIIWLITRPSRRSLARTSTSTIFSMLTAQRSPLAAMFSSTTTPASRPTRPFSTLRLKVLRKILTSNPILARPLKDATVRVLRLVRSEKPLDVDQVRERLGEAVFETARQSMTGIAPDGTWLNEAMLPSKEALLTLLWVLTLEEKKMTSESTTTTTSKASVKPGQQKAACQKRTNTDVCNRLGADNDRKRRRVN